MRWISRSSGPSKLSSLTGMASAEDSKSRGKSICCCLTITHHKGHDGHKARSTLQSFVSFVSFVSMVVKKLTVADLDRVPDALHRFRGDAACALRPLDDDLLQSIRPGHQGG